MGKRAGGYAQLIADIPDDQSLGMSTQEKANNSQARFCTHGGKHVGVPSDLFRVFLFGHAFLPLIFR
jgi:hypothetical protein